MSDHREHLDGPAEGAVPDPKTVKESPEGLALRALPRRVVRLNRRTLIAVVAVLSAIVLGVTFWTLRSKPTSARGAEALRNVDHVARAEGFEKLPKDYSDLRQVPKLGAPVGEFGRPLLQAERNAGLEPLPETSNFSPNHTDDADRAARLTEQQEAQEAVKSKVFFSLRQQPTTSIKPGESAAGDLAAAAAAQAQATSNSSEPKSDRLVAHIANDLISLLNLFA